MTSTTCRENKARTEVPEECCENGGLGAFDDDRRDTFMTRSPVLVRFYRSTTETGMKTKPSSQIETRYQCIMRRAALLSGVKRDVGQESEDKIGKSAEE